MNVWYDIGYFLNLTSKSFWEEPHVEYTIDLIICLIITNVVVGYLYKKYLYRINWIKYRDDDSKTQRKVDLFDIVILVIVNTSTTCYFEFNQQFVENNISEFFRNIFLLSAFSVILIMFIMCICPNKVGAYVYNFMSNNKICNKKKSISNACKYFIIILIMGLMDVIIYSLGYII